MAFSLRLDIWFLVFQFMPYSCPSCLTITLCLSSRPVSYPENHYSLTPAGGDRVLPYRNPSTSFSSPSPGLVGFSTVGPPGVTPGPFVRYKPSPDRCVFVFLFFTLSSVTLLPFVTHDNCFVYLRQIIRHHKRG